MHHLPKCDAERAHCPVVSRTRVETAKSVPEDPNRLPYTLFLLGSIKYSISLKAVIKPIYPSSPTWPIYPETAMPEVILYDIPSKDPRHCWSLNPWKSSLHAMTLIAIKNLKNTDQCDSPAHSQFQRHTLQDRMARVSWHCADSQVIRNSSQRATFYSLY